MTKNDSRIIHPTDALGLNAITNDREVVEMWVRNALAETLQSHQKADAIVQGTGAERDKMVEDIKRTGEIIDHHFDEIVSVCLGCLAVPVQRGQVTMTLAALLGAWTHGYSAAIRAVNTGVASKLRSAGAPVGDVDPQKLSRASSGDDDGLDEDGRRAVAMADCAASEMNGSCDGEQ